MKKIKYIYFVGIKGVGMAPLAIIAKEAGFIVSGSDVKESFITDKALLQAKIPITIGFSGEHIKNADIIITTGAHGGYDNPEVVCAKAKKIPVLTQGEAVGVFMKGKIFGRDYEGISVAGTHGKTTTTAMIATIFSENKLDPAYLIGTGNVASLGMPGHFGKGRFFIAEADEYATEPVYDKTPKFLWQYPTCAVITNIEYDHPDLYPSIDKTREAFIAFVKNISPKGVLIACGDDIQIRKLLHKYHGIVTTYGFSKTNDVVINKIHISGKQTFFWVEANGMSLGEFVIPVPGEHNALNATAALLVSKECGIPLENIKKGLLAFHGSMRRFEYIGTLSAGGQLYDDYAHHPTEVKKTLQSVRQGFPKNTIVCVFQPHTYSRTRELFEEFLQALSLADVVIITNIYASMREIPDTTVSSYLLAEKLKLKHRNTIFLPGLTDVVEYIKQQAYGRDTIILTMGAGDIYTIHKALLSAHI